MTAISIFIFSYNYQFMVFPAYTELEKRTSARFYRASQIATSIYVLSFSICAVVGVLLFGRSVHTDILSSIAQRSGKVSVFMRISYSCMLLMQIPYYFFASKEYVLVLFDEITYKSMS